MVVRTITITPATTPSAAAPAAPLAIAILPITASMLPAAGFKRFAFLLFLFAVWQPR
jgi:hypothetical protein